MSDRGVVSGGRTFKQQIRGEIEKYKVPQDISPSKCKVKILLKT